MAHAHVDEHVRLDAVVLESIAVSKGGVDGLRSVSVCSQTTLATLAVHGAS